MLDLYKEGPLLKGPQVQMCLGIQDFQRHQPGCPHIICPNKSLDLGIADIPGLEVKPSLELDYTYSLSPGPGPEISLPSLCRTGESPCILTRRPSSFHSFHSCY